MIQCDSVNRNYSKDTIEMIEKAMVILDHLVEQKIRNKAYGTATIELVFRAGKIEGIDVTEKTTIR